MGMKTYDVVIEGISPLLCNRFTDEAQMAASNGTRAAQVGGRKSPQEAAEGGLYLDETGSVGIPGPNLFRCLIDAGTYFKNGKSKVTTMKSSIIPACLAIEEVFVPIEHEQPWKVDTRPVRIPSTGGRILKHRPCFDDWRLSFTLELDTEIMSPALLRDIVDAAGKRIGVGDFRPACKGPFGRFKVVHWKEAA